MSLFTLLSARRSVREYTSEPVRRDDLQRIVDAGLMTPSSKNLHSTHLLVLDDPETVHRLAACKPHFGDMLKKAPAAIVVLGQLSSHAWVEDASVTLTAMLLAAAELGLGACWVQVRHMVSESVGEDGKPLTSDQFIRRLLHIPEGVEVEAILALGHPTKQHRPRTLEEMKPERVHWGKW